MVLIENGVKQGLYSPKACGRSARGGTKADLTRILTVRAWATEAVSDAVPHEVPFHPVLCLQKLPRPKWMRRTEQMAKAAGFLPSQTAPRIGSQAIGAEKAIQARRPVRKTAEKSVLILTFHANF
jgi:hypothetical protein